MLGKRRQLADVDFARSSFEQAIFAKLSDSIDRHTSWRQAKHQATRAKTARAVLLLSCGCGRKLKVGSNRLHAAPVPAGCCGSSGVRPLTFARHMVNTCGPSASSLDPTQRSARKHALMAARRNGVKGEEAMFNMPSKRLSKRASSSAG
ncbi:hypothetical protein PSPO01_10892 [Paraphaeosphaeria sporulosa]